MVLIIIILMFIQNLHTFTIKDKFLYCKTTDKTINLETPCEDTILKGLNCSKIKSSIDFALLNENSFNVINGSLTDLEPFIVFTKNKKLFYCRCDSIDEIEIAEEVEKVNDDCINDLYVHFNNKSGFLTKNGIIKERTFYTHCDGIPKSFYSTTYQTEMIKYDNRVVYSKISSLKNEIDDYSKEIKLLELIWNKVVENGGKNSYNILFLTVSFVTLVYMSGTICYKLFKRHFLKKNSVEEIESQINLNQSDNLPESLAKIESNLEAINKKISGLGAQMVSYEIIHKINQEISHLPGYFKQAENKIDTLNEMFSFLNNSHMKFENKLDTINEKISVVPVNFENIENKLIELQDMDKVILDEINKTKNPLEERTTQIVTRSTKSRAK